MIYSLKSTASDYFMCTPLASFGYKLTLLSTYGVILMVNFIVRKPILTWVDSVAMMLQIKCQSRLSTARIFKNLSLTRYVTITTCHKM